MKGVLRVLVITALVWKASAQDGGAQMRSLEQLGRTSNSTLVQNLQCTTNDTSTNLFCNFTGSKELVVSPNGAALREVMFQICLCDSAMRLKYTLSDDSTHAVPCSQCPAGKFVFAHLQIENDFNVYKDEYNITRIHVLVKLLANDPDNQVTVFNNTVSLNQQDMDCNGTITPPPISCDVPTTTMHTMTSQPMSTMVAYWKIIVPIVCFCLACAIVALTITLAYVFIWRKKPTKSVYDSVAQPINGADEKSNLHVKEKEKSGVL